MKHKISIGFSRLYNKDGAECVLPTVSFFYNKLKKSFEIDIPLLFWMIEVDIYKKY